MNLETELLKTYQLCENSGLVDNCDKIESETVLLPLYHTNRRSDGKNIIKVVLNDKGEVDFNSSGFVLRNEYIIYPITENSLVRSSNVEAHPLADEISYIVAPESSKKSGLYQQQLKAWLDAENDTLTKKFLSIVHHFVNKTNVLEAVVQIIAKNNDYQLDREKMELTVNKIDGKSEKFSLEKTVLTFEILALDNGKDMSVSKSKHLHNCYIEYVEKQAKNKQQQICNLTGKEMYCSNKHRGVFGSAKIISASNHSEVYIGRFDNTGNDIISIGQQTSQKIHNMLKYLLENDNSRKWLGESIYLLTWFSDDVANIDAVDIAEPNEIDFGYDVDEAEYIVAGSLTKQMLDSVGGTNKFKEQINAYILIIDKVSNGRVAINYFQTIPKSIFADNVNYWKNTLNWYFYDKITKTYILKTPNNNFLLTYLYGTERNDKLEFSKNEGNFKANLSIKLLKSLVERKAIPLDFYKKACQNIRTRNRYKKNWNTVLAISCAIINKYYSDSGRERIGKEMLSIEKQSRDYLYGRILYLFEYIERQAMDDNSRLTNAEKFWNSYLAYPQKTILNLEKKIHSYKVRLMRSEYAWKLKRAEKAMAECTSLLEQLGEVGSQDKPLNEEFIFGYYAQQSEIFTKTETTK